MKKLIAILTLAAAAAACAADTPVTPGAQPGTQSPGTTGSPTGTPATPAGTQVTLYYLVEGADDFYLTAERHTVARTEAIARAALEELLHGTPQDEDHSTPFPKATKVNSVVISDAVATVDWSAEALTGSGGGRVEALAIQSIVYTLTEFPTITKVRFTVEGKSEGTASNGRSIEDFWGAVGMSGQPWDRDPEIDVLAPITLWTPLEAAASSGTLKLTGLAQTFEANVGIILRNAAGKIVVQTNATALEAAPAREPFTKKITFTPPSSPETWTLEVFEASAMDGSIDFMEDRTIRVG
ncbi:MAG TPA: GerMN domain-containing protein [Actinomycetota bacterium]|nr:GerMN domain-containing protein [Actinomycetota bacterium]